MVNRRFRTIAAAFGATAVSSTLAFAAPQAQGVYLDEGGLIVCPFESNVPVSHWDLSTSTNGYVGEGYFVWDGPNYFTQPGQGTFAYDFEVNTGGTWRLAIRNRHEDPDPTEENDVWVRVDDGPWIKTFSNGPDSVGSWTWETRFELGHGNYPDASYNLSVGQHRIEFSGRSHGFKMDRFHLYRPGTAGANDPNRPESPRRFGTESCNATSNTTGSASEIVAIGSPFASNNSLRLETSDLPSNVFGYFLASRTEGFFANPGGSSGNLCLGGTIGRFVTGATNTGGSGTASYEVDMTMIPRPDGTTDMITAGQTWYFQFWHRDGGAVSNFSPALEITFE